MIGLNEEEKGTDLYFKEYVDAQDGSHGSAELPAPYCTERP